MTRFSHDVRWILDLSDELERTAIAREIAREIREEEPQVIGVYGWWGAGKSYLLSQVIKHLLESNENEQVQMIVGVFEAWKYEMKGDLPVGLIRAFMDIEKGFKNESLFTNPETYKSIGKGLLELLAIAGPLLGPTGAVVGVAGEMIKAGITNVQDYKEAVADSGKEAQVDQIDRKIKELIQQIIRAAKRQESEPNPRLVMFIDDLDRCSPRNMVRMFEWLKVHLSVEHCTYVMALDNVAAAQAIVGQYRDYLGSEHEVGYGFRYLEKLVDTEYELALPERAELMALRQVCREDKYERVSEYTRAQTKIGDFPGVEYMDRLLKFRSLRIPRTMLKIVDRYRRILDLLRSSRPAAIALRNDLGGLSYPFWTLFLIAMYYRLDPHHMDDFVRGRGLLYGLMSGRDASDEEKWPGGEASPEYEFCHFAREFHELAGTSVPIPRPDNLQRLAALIREKTLPEANS